MAKTFINGNADLPNYLNKDLPPGDWVDVTQDMIDKFAEISGDPMAIKTRVTEMLGIEHPIVQGGMHERRLCRARQRRFERGGPRHVVTALTQPSPRRCAPRSSAAAR
jgi:hypothetical protein